MLIPLAFIAALAAFLFVPHINANATLTASFTGAAVVLALWYGWLWMSRRPLKIEVALRPQHYLQAIAHASIFVYWGMYWPPIRDAAPLIIGQIVFAYAFDGLATRRECGERDDAEQRKQRLRIEKPHTVSQLNPTPGELHGPCHTSRRRVQAGSRPPIACIRTNF